MARYIALLGGINVGGHRVKMTQLSSLFTELGLEHVRTYISSGNVMFMSTGEPSTLEARIAAHLGAELGYRVPVFIRTVEQLDELISEAPFDPDGPGTDERFCVAFTAQPLNVRELPFPSSKNDMKIIGVRDREAYIVWCIVNGRPPSGRFPKEAWPEANTTRFFHTLKKIADAARHE